MNGSSGLLRPATALIAACLGLPAGAHAAAVSVLYQFAGAEDGDGRAVALLAGSNGPVATGTIIGVSDDAGTTKVCGGAPCGSIVSFTPPATKGDPYQFGTLYSFKGGLDGAKPNTDSILQGADGALYGTAQYGGTQHFPAGGGVVWKLAPPVAAGGAWTYAVLWSFKTTGDPAGYAPIAGLAIDSAGVLYGMTTAGTANGLGGVFSLAPPTPPATAWTETVLSVFPAKTKPTDVSSALTAPVFSSNEASLFGPAATNGAIFQLHRTPKTTPPWTYKKIFGFTHASVSLSNLLIYPRTPKGNVYGVVTPTSGNGGEAFQLTQPAGGTGLWTVQDLFDFDLLRSLPFVPKGAPSGHIVASSATFALFGSVGMPGDAVYRLAPPPAGSTTWAASTVATLDSAQRGVLPPTGIYAGLGGNFIGASATGGTNGKGVLFQVNP